MSHQPFGSPSSNPLLRPPPAACAAAGERAFDALVAAAAGHGADLPADAAWCDTARAVFGASEFVARVAERQPAAFAALAADGMPAPGDADALARRLEATVAATLIDAEDEQGLMRALRRFRALQSACIAWRDLTGQAGIDATLAAQSALADACIRVTLARLETWARARHGVPRDASGQPLSLVVLGMGKLGGGELNFSSDIDLIMLYGEPGATDGERPLEHDAYFMRLGQRLIRILDERTPDGYAFRVDMRLRPFGNSGPLVMHAAQLEQYLLTQAREWERFALVKARPISGDQPSVQAIEGLLRPFVFRRYLDFGAFESLRDLKARLEREMARKGIHGNVKYGRGGIREVEFVAQAFQLIRGGREPCLRQRSLLDILGALDQLGELPPVVIADLAAAYRFLRRVENRLQARADERVHALPRGREDRAWLAWVLGLDGEVELDRELDHHTGRVQACFSEVFNIPGPEGEGQGTAEDAGPGAVWDGELAEDEAEATLLQAGFSEPADARRRLETLQHSSRYRSLSATARARLDTLMPLLLADVAAVAANGRTLGRLLALIEAVARRSVYLSLLAEHAAARRRLVELCAASAWIADFVTRHPILLDELIDPDSLYEPLDRAAVAVEIEEALVGVDSEDLEAQMEVLRQVRQTNVLRVAAVDITGRLPLMRVSDYLTWIAEAVLEAVHRLVYHQTVARYGRPRSRVDGVEREPAFGIVAYGKLGGLELGYGSDLDLVFLYDAEGEDLGTDAARELDNSTFFARLAQRIIHFLNTPTPAGVLYEIDTRLRPNGSAGMLVSTLDAFTRYQNENAWTWEHQALVRARMVVGDQTLARRFDAVRADVLQRPRDPDTLLDEVVSMRERMRRELARGGRERFDLKQDRGGVADIEFMVQYGVLVRACAAPALVEYTDNVRLIEALAAHGHLGADEARLLTDAYRGFRTRIHRLALLDAPAVVAPDDELAGDVDAVAALWERRMGGLDTEQ